MAALIILVNADRKSLKLTEARLSAAGYLVAAVSSFPEAKQLLASVTPDLLVTDVRLAAFNGLHLAIRSRLEHPRVPVIVSHTSPDPVVEAEARNCGAEFIAAPLDNPEFLSRVESILAEHRQIPPVRRWSRKQLAGTVQVNAADAMARIIDMSYGGVKLAFRDQPDVPTVFDITLPDGVTVKAHRVWTGRSTTDQLWCGAELEDVPTPHWRRFVDSLPS
jgi:DNA-binding response OmpR family regulator